MTIINVKILCANRMVCEYVISEMNTLGFTNVKEVYNKVDADIISTLEFDNNKERDKIFEALLSNTGEKISQISY